MESVEYTSHFIEGYLKLGFEITGKISLAKTWDPWKGIPGQGPEIFGRGSQAKDLGSLEGDPRPRT